MRALPERNVSLADVLDLGAEHCLWEFTPAEVARCLTMISPLQQERLMTIVASGRPFAGPFSKRMRDLPGSAKREQRVEFREGIASALRVIKGGSSKQFVIIITPDGKIRMRAIQPREAARLMGLPDNYVLPRDPTEALSLCGDGVVVPVVRFLAERVLKPALASQTAAGAAE